jgi:hypothetical protein
MMCGIIDRLKRPVYKSEIDVFSDEMAFLLSDVLLSGDWRFLDSAAYIDRCFRIKKGTVWALCRVLEMMISPIISEFLTDNDKRLKDIRSTIIQAVYA